MPQIAILSDIHANLHALEAVLAEVDEIGVDHLVCAGDIVGYGPRPAECLSLIRERGVVSVLGNHDQYTLLLREQVHPFPSASESLENPVWAGLYHALRELDDEALDWLASLPLVMGIPGALVAHAALHDFEEWPYLIQPEDAVATLEILSRSPDGVGFFGHTHRQTFFPLEGTPAPEIISSGNYRMPPGAVCAVVVGSVGQPRTRDNRAAWVLWDSDRRIFEFRRTEYPVHLTAAEIREAGLPSSSASRLL